jgi:putative restriction endonuclease
MNNKKRIIIANIVWNRFGWRNIYVNPRSGFRYARENPGHESLNFEFNKKGLDDETNVHGFIQFSVGYPTNLDEHAIILFYSKNLETSEGEIVGIYGDAKILQNEKRTKWKGFENDELISNVVAKKELSLLFPIPLKSEIYSQGARLVPQANFTYKDEKIAEKIIIDEIRELKKSGIKLEDYKKLIKLYEFITGSEYSEKEIDDNEKEQEELLPIVKDLQRTQITKELKEITPQIPELVEFRGKQYKRDNKSIVELKILREFKCQMCGTSILKKDGSFYVEAAHITEKKHKGPESPDNILILCPNHHKEFDFGNKKIIDRTKEKLYFELNGRKYNISLELK